MILDYHQTRKPRNPKKPKLPWWLVILVAFLTPFVLIGLLIALVELGWTP